MGIEVEEEEEESICCVWREKPAGKNEVKGIWSWKIWVSMDISRLEVWFMNLEALISMIKRLGFLG